jgi:hypothetical protein
MTRDGMVTISAGAPISGRDIDIESLVSELKENCYWLDTPIAINPDTNVYSLDFRRLLRTLHVGI